MPAQHELCVIKTAAQQHEHCLTKSDPHSTRPMLHSQSSKIYLPYEYSQSDENLPQNETFTVSPRLIAISRLGSLFGCRAQICAGVARSLPYQG